MMSLVSETSGASATYHQADLHQTQFCYRAPVTGGYVELCLSDHRPREVDDDLHAALELAKLEHLVRPLEDWLGQGLEFECCPSVVPSRPLFRIFKGASASQPISVSVPLYLWLNSRDQLPGLDSNAGDVDWMSYYSRIHLDSLSLSAVDIERLKPGAVVLMPGSYSEQWGVSLRVPALQYCQTGLLVKEPFYWQGMLEFPQELDSNSDVTRSPGQSGIEGNNIGCYFEVTTDLLLKSGNELNSYVNRKIIETLCVLNTACGKRFTGRPVPVGSGYGLRIEHVLQPGV